MTSNNLYDFSSRQSRHYFIFFSLHLAHLSSLCLCVFSACLLPVCFCSDSYPPHASPKKGNLDEINNHFSNFHNYRPPKYSEEVWEQVSADNVYLVRQDGNAAPSQAEAEREALMEPHNPPQQQLPPPLAATNAAAYHHQQQMAPSSHVLQSLSPYCLAPPPSNITPSLWAEVVALPGSDYSAVGPPMLSSATVEAAPANCTTMHQDFYTCVQLMNESGEVHLVPCLPPTYCRDFPPPAPREKEGEEKEEEEEKKKSRKQAEHQARKGEGKHLPVS